MKSRFYVSNDVSALAAGADRVAAELAKQGKTVVRTSSRGAFFLEPLVEMDALNGRVAWANCTEKETARKLVGKQGFDPQTHPFLAKQTRFTFARAGLIDPLSIEDFKKHGGFRGLEKALDLDPQKIIDEMKTSGLRGRGGAAFPAGVKWQTTKDAPADQKYVVANADEGDPGTYSDRMIMEGEPYRLIEGMAICARAVGATKGYIYAPERIPARHPETARRDRAPRSGMAATRSTARPSTSSSRSSSARAPTSAVRDRAPRSLEESAGFRQAALPGDRRTSPQADRRQQRHRSRRRPTSSTAAAAWHRRWAPRRARARCLQLAGCVGAASSRSRSA